MSWRTTSAGISPIVVGLQHRPVGQMRDGFDGELGCVLMLFDQELVNLTAKGRFHLRQNPSRGFDPIKRQRLDPRQGRIVANNSFDTILEQPLLSQLVSMTVCRPPIHNKISLTRQQCWHQNFIGGLNDLYRDLGPVAQHRGDCGCGKGRVACTIIHSMLWRRCFSALRTWLAIASLPTKPIFVAPRFDLP